MVLKLKIVLKLMKLLFGNKSKKDACIVLFPLIYENISATLDCRFGITFMLLN